MTKNTKIILGIIIAVVIIGGIWLGVSREADTPVSKDGEAVKIGVILPLTGDAADYGQSAQKAVDLAVEKINKEYNMEIDIVFEDSQMKPQDAVSSLQKLVSINGIKYVIGFSSGETLAMCPISESKKIILLSSGSSPEITKCGDYTFRNCPSDIYQGKVLADKTYNQDHKKVAIMYINNDYGAGLKKEFEKNFDGEILIAEAHNPSSTDFKTQLTKIKSKNPDAIILISHLLEATNILKQRTELGINQPIFTSEALKDPNLFEKVSNDVLKNVYIIFISQYQGIEYQEYKNAYLQKYNEKHGAFSDYVYDNVLTLVNAIKECENINDAECVKSNLYKTDMGGATGNIKFDNNGDIVDRSYTLYKADNGEFVPYEESK